MKTYSVNLELQVKAADEFLAVSEFLNLARRDDVEGRPFLVKDLANIENNYKVLPSFHKSTLLKERNFIKYKYTACEMISLFCKSFRERKFFLFDKYIDSIFNIIQELAALPNNKQYYFCFEHDDESDSDIIIWDAND